MVKPYNGNGTDGCVPVVYADESWFGENGLGAVLDVGYAGVRRTLFAVARRQANQVMASPPAGRRAIVQMPVRVRAVAMSVFSPVSLTAAPAVSRMSP